MNQPSDHSDDPTPRTEPPSGPAAPATLRATLAEFDVRERKIVGGLTTVMLRHPDRVRDREWISEQFTQVTLLAGGFETNDDATETVADVGRFIQENASSILGAAYLLFQRVSEDMAERAERGFTYDDAVAQALSYFMP